MDLNEGILKANSNSDLPPGGFISVNDDNEMFWSNIRPSLQEGYWGNNDRGYMTEYLGMYTGDKFWTQTLIAL